MQKLTELEQDQLRTDLPDFRAGDTIRVNVKLVEGEKTRIQGFEGICIRRNGGGVQTTFMVRKISYGVGVERTFFLNSPMIDGISVIRYGRVRRARLYYLRDRVGKKARVRERRR